MNREIVLYGAGKHGRSVLGFLRHQGLEDRVLGFVDGDSKKIGTRIDDKPIISYEEAKKRGLVFVITLSDVFHDEIRKKLKEDGVDFYNDISSWEQKVLHRNHTEINRAFCAYYHISDMDTYFEEAESDASIDIFWGKSSPFYAMFKRLDLKNVVELACGRGRHVEKYIDNAENVTLVDILEKNISFCRKRFEDRHNIHYYRNNGHDLSELADDCYTAIFSYDAMVHFELFDIYEYLNETYRILKMGGIALFHHSNTSTSFDQSFENSGNPGGRNFMSKELFAYLAHKAGMKVIEQKVVDWSLPEMDCLTLLQKTE